MWSLRAGVVPTVAGASAGHVQHRSSSLPSRLLPLPRKLPLLRHSHGRVLAAAGSGIEPGKDADDVRDTVLAEFMRHVDNAQLSWPLEGRKPTVLMPPNTIVRVLMDALMRNDWPDDNSGIRTAFSFSMPVNVNELPLGQVAKPLARAWDAMERYLSFPEFAEVIRDSMYAPLINCSAWEAASMLTFHGPGDRRAVQAVKITSQSEAGTPVRRTYTFCLEKVEKGAYRNCWMVVGVRMGDYANV